MTLEDRFSQVFPHWSMSQVQTPYCLQDHTFVWHLSPGFQVHFAVPLAGALLGIVANGVAAVLATTQADALLETIRVCTLEGKALLVFIDERIYKQMD